MTNSIRAAASGCASLLYTLILEPLFSATSGSTNLCLEPLAESIGRQSDDPLRKQFEELLRQAGSHA